MGRGRMGERVFIAIGSNLGDREANCRSAIEHLKGDPRVRVIKESAFYETEPWGKTEQPAFINAAVEIETDLAPKELLALLKNIEDRVGRKARERWGPREIDLDIIFYGDRVIKEEGLTIPHPEAHNRRFVIEPIAEMAPEFIHPVLEEKLYDILIRLHNRPVRNERKE